MEDCMEEVEAECKIVLNDRHVCVVLCFDVL